MATRVNISKALELKIRAGKNADKLVGELVKLLDAAQQRATTSRTGLGYAELVALFRSHLGDRLVVPKNPSVGYITRIVNRAKELGILAENVPTIVRGLKMEYPTGLYRLEFVVYRADVFADRAERGATNVHTVHTGRFDDE